MAKYKLVRKDRKGLPQKPGAVPCAILIVTAMALMSYLFYSVLTSSVK